jgi:hypothetical protein
VDGLNVGRPPLFSGASGAAGESLWPCCHTPHPLSTE